MKFTHKFASLLVAFGSLLVASTAGAATYAAGDLLLGFRATGGTGANTDYIIDLGSSTSFRDAAGGTSLGSYGTDLTAIYGAGWSTRSDLYWGAITMRQSYNPITNPAVNGDPSGTLYATTSSNIPFAQISSGGTSYLGMAGQFGGLAASGNAANASLSLLSDSPSQIWTAQMGATSFGGSLPNIETALSAGSSIGVYRFLSTTAKDTYTNGTVPVGTAHLVNSISINSSGQISVAAIPEASSAFLGVFGALILLRRRRD